MKFQTAAAKLDAYRQQIADIRGKMRKLQAQAEAEAVKDYEFATAEGPRKLSELFGDKDDLIVIHNMGITCPNCTLWADGFNGLYPHLANRASFVVASPDSLSVQKEFAAGRGWRFPMVSLPDKEFAADMGYHGKDGYMPGVSVFRREDGQIIRVSTAEFKPFDDFCTAWHILEMLPGGIGSWNPKFNYS